MQSNVNSVNFPCVRFWGSSCGVKSTTSSFFDVNPCKELPA